MKKNKEQKTKKGYLTTWNTNPKKMWPGRYLFLDVGTR